MQVKLTYDAFLDAVKDNKYAIVELTSPGCTGCRCMAPVIKTVMDEVNDNEIVVNEYLLDTMDESVLNRFIPQVNKWFSDNKNVGIMLPVFVFYRSNKVHNMLCGVQNITAFKEFVTDGMNDAAP